MCLRWNRIKFRDVIELPAELCGLKFESGLVELILKDMEDQPAGALPLLSQTLHLLWQKRQQRRLTSQAYRELGGIEGALKTHADQVYEDLLASDEEQEQCRRILKLLTNPRGRHRGYPPQGEQGPTGRW